METVEIKCLKSMLNVAERAKKAKTAIYQALERVRDEEAAGSNPVIPTKKRVNDTTRYYLPFFIK